MIPLPQPPESPNIRAIATWLDTHVTSGVGVALAVYDETTQLTTAATVLRFLGNAVTATASGSDVTVTIASDMTQAAADARYLQLSGGTLTGELDIGNVSGLAAGLLRVGGAVTAAGMFTGPDFALSGPGGAPAPGGGSPIAVLDEGAQLTPDVTSLNFVGAGVTASVTGNAVTVSVVDTFTQAAADARYLQLSGGTLTGALTVNGASIALPTDAAELNTTYGGVTTTRFFTDSGGGAISVDGANSFRIKTGGKTGTAQLAVASTGVVTAAGMFTGPDFALSGPGGAPAPGGGSPIAVLDEGAQLTPDVTSLNFVGAGVTASVTGNAVTVSVVDTFTQAAADARYLQLSGGALTGLLTCTAAASTSNAIAMYVGAEANARFYQRADGYMAWGSGSTTQDTSLYRSNAYEMTLTGALIMSNVLRIDGSGSTRLWFHNSGYEDWYVGAASGATWFSIGSATNPTAVRIDNNGDVQVARDATTGVLYFGTDRTTYLYRSSVNLLDIHNLHLNFVDGYGIRSGSGNAFYSNAPYWVNQSHVASPGGIRFTDSAGTLKGYLYWDGSGIGILNEQGGFALRCNYGASYGGSLSGAWTTSGSHTAADFVLA